MQQDFEHLQRVVLSSRLQGVHEGDERSKETHRRQLQSKAKAIVRSAPRLVAISARSAHPNS